jgi:putative transposase
MFPNDPVFFVTCCTHRRQRWLTDYEIHSTFIEFSERAYSDWNIAVGRYVLMPDHLHLFVAGPPEFVLGKWIGTMKRCLEKTMKSDLLKNQRWQRGFFDHVLRSAESYSQKWDYVRQNPVRAGLVSHPDDWPFAGEIVAISGP